MEPVNYPYATEGVPMDVPDDWHVACCDCGLIHVMSFSFRKEGKFNVLQASVKRDNRATAQRRRHMDVELKPKRKK